MSSSYVFIGSAFSVQSAQLVAAATVRVRYTRIPNQSNPLLANDALNPTNYVFTGPGAASALLVTSVSGEPQSVDVTFAAPLLVGSWVVVVSNVETPTATAISSPTSATFAVSNTTNASALNPGGVNDSAEEIIRKHLNPYLKGDNWDALIAALAAGDELVNENIQAAFDQMFKSSASGIFLKRLAANDGTEYPESVGLSDDLFRRLSILLTTEKLTHHAIKKLLEIFYGEDSLHAYVETALPENYVLADGDQLVVKCENTSYTVTFESQQFRLIAQATAEEVAVVITKALSDAGYQGVAKVNTNPVDGLQRVRIYSAALGLESSIQVTGGNAQLALQFDTMIPVYSGTVTSGSGYNWVYTNPVYGKTRVSLTTTGLALIGLESVRDGDYVLIGSSAASVVGQYTIDSIGYSWSGGNYTQYFDLTEDIGFTGSSLQADNTAYSFFRPTRKTTNQGSRTVVVAQTGVDNAITVQIPATSSAVSRDSSNAAYLKTNGSVDVTKITRIGSTVTVDAAAAHGISAGQGFFVDGFVPASSRPYSLHADFLSLNLGGGHVEGYSSTATSYVQSKNGVVAVRLTGGDLIFAGGYGYTTSMEEASSNNVVGLRMGAAPVISDGSQADGATNQEYSYVGGFFMNNARRAHAGSALIGAFSDQMLVSGGASNNVFPMSLYNNGEVRDSSGSWTNTGLMVTNRHSHAQITLNDGRCLVVGGMINGTTSTNAVEVYTPGLNVWNPLTGMNTARSHHSLEKLSTGNIMAIGGRLGGRSIGATDSDLFAYWKMDELGVTFYDSTSGARDLNLAGLAGPIQEGKVNGGIQFSGGKAFYPGDATLRDLFRVGGYSFDCWVYSNGNDGPIIAMGGNGATDPDNVLFAVALKTQQIVVGWETSATNLVETIPSYTIPLGWFHVAVSVSDSQKVHIYVNGALADSDQLAPPTDGSASLLKFAEELKYYAILQVLCIDEARIWSTVLDERRIRNLYLAGAGSYQSTNNPSDVTDTVEYYVPSTDIWHETGRLNVARESHHSWVYNDNVYVIGGFGYKKSSPSELVLGDQSWPLSPVSEIEMWDSASGRWNVVGKVPAGALSGAGVFADTDTSVWFNGYVLDKETLTWRAVPAPVPDRSWAIAGPNNEIVLGGRLTYPDSYENYDVFRFLGQTSTRGDINGLKIATTAPTSTQLTTGSKFAGFTSNFGSMLGGATQNYRVSTLLTIWDQFVGTITLVNGMRISNVTTMTVSSGHGLSVGQTVFINQDNSNFTNGLKVLTSVSATTIQYAETAANVGAPVSLIGTVDVQTSTPTITAIEQAPSALDNVGPYVFDTDTFSTEGSGTTLTTAIPAGSVLSTLEVASTAEFPDSPGFIVLGFGTNHQIGPIPYLEKVSNTVLLLNSHFVPEIDLDAGVSVIYIRAVEPGQPPVAAGNAYITGSSAGRVAAQLLVDESAAAGIDTNVTVIYPGDRGLGGEGNPTSGDGKLSDAVKVWGGDNG